MQIFRLLFILCLLITFQAKVYAGNRINAGTITLGAAYDYFSAKRHIKNTGFPFLALGYDLTEHWGVEGLIARFAAVSKRPEDDGRQVKGSLFAFDGIYHFSPINTIEPFLLAGVGVIGMNPNGTDANNQGNLNVGAGAQFFFHKDIALRLEARDFYTMSSSNHDVIVDGGVTFLFDVC